MKMLEKSFPEAIEEEENEDNLDYDDEKKECHVSFGEPRLIDSSQNLKEEIDALRDSMAAMRFGYISKKNVARENLSVEAEREKKEEIIAEYSSIKEAAMQFSKSTHSSISLCCNGKYKTAFGFKWKYKN